MTPDPCRQALAAWVGLASVEPGDDRAAAERAAEVRAALPDDVRPAFDRWWDEWRSAVGDVRAAGPVDRWFARACP